MKKTLMLRTGWIVVACCLIQVIVCTPSIAKDNPTLGGHLPTRTYFKSNPTDGAPILAANCGYNNTNKGWVNRDLGEGVNVEVGITYEEKKPVSATLLFRYHDGKLILLPDHFELHALPNERTYKPSEVRRNIYVPNNEDCAQLGEWVRLEFPVQAALVENVDLLIPNGTVTKREIIKIRPFRFQKATDASYSDNPRDGAVIIGNRDPIKSSSDLEEGLLAFENEDYGLAYKKLHPLAEGGVAMAQNAVGRMYMQGKVVPQNFNKALILFHKAANQGLANAQSNLGVMYAAGTGIEQDHKQAIVWFRKAANQGFAIAMNNLADMYENGLGVTPDHVEADKWRKKSQHLGSAKNNDLIKIETAGNSEYEKGLNYYYGYNFASASELFLKAAEKGHPEAQLKLAWMYQHGQGVQKSEAQAQYWTQKAKRGGHTLNDNRDRVLLIDPSSEKSK